ncbi:MAG TPA: hypothetical protein VND83_01255 [Acidimicrobiales bacterium]|nr:hypothetical protein [Acidimicrobiales bacterium]
MRSIDERLKASDPAVAGYEHPRFGAMVARVVATPISRRDATWRSFRLKVAAAVALTGAVTGAGIAALSTSGVALPVLSFAAAAGHQTGSDAATKYAAEPMMILQRNYEFTGASNFSSAAGSAIVYTMSAPSDPVATLSSAATTLGVNVGTPASADNGQSFSSTGPKYAGYIITGGGFASWGISLTDQSGIVTSSSAETTDAFNATALSDASQLGTFDLGTPTATVQGTDASAPVEVNVPILVGGRVTNLSYDFVFAVDGSLVSANGVSFTLTPLGEYPLISPAAGVDQIKDQLFVASDVAGWTAASGGVLSTGSSSTGSATPVTPPTVVNGSSSPGSAPSDTTPPSTDDTTTTTMPPVVVNLTVESDEYGAYAMSDGSTLLLPVYVYTGDVVGQGYQASFRVIPVDPAYLDLSLAVRPGIY